MLITKTDISNVRDISRGVRDEKINPFIEDAEILDLLPLLGEQFYHDLAANTTSQIYVDLLEPKEYTYDGKTYKHHGLKRVLSIFAYSRYIVHGSFTDTGFGFVQKANQDSQPVSETQKRNIYTQERQTAVAYFNEVALYINRNITNYPLWGSSHKSGTSSFRVSKITI